MTLESESKSSVRKQIPLNKAISCKSGEEKLGQCELENSHARSLLYNHSHLIKNHLMNAPGLTKVQ